MEYTLSAILWRIVGVLFLVFLNGFFVAAEFTQHPAEVQMPDRKVGIQARAFAQPECRLLELL